MLLLLCKCRTLHLLSVLNPAVKGALTERLWQILPQKIKILGRAPWMLVLTRTRREAFAVAEVAEESRVSMHCIRSVCLAGSSVSTAANPFLLPLLEKMITWDGKGIDSWGCQLQIKSESSFVGTKTKLCYRGNTVLLEVSLD